MRKHEVVDLVIGSYPEIPLIFTTGFASRYAYGASPLSPNHFYMMGSMGCASALARGVAAGWSGAGKPVVVDGDGAFLMGAQSLLLELETPGTDIVHVVANDQAYASTGAQPIPRSVDVISELALAAGYGSSTTLSDVDDLRSALSRGQEEPGSHLLNVMVTSGAPPASRVDRPCGDIARGFETFIGNGPMTRQTSAGKQ